MKRFPRRIVWLTTAMSVVSLLAACEKSEAGGSADAPGFDCAAHAKQLGGTAVAPLQVTPDSDLDGSCYRQMNVSLGGNDVWHGMFAGPFATEDAWTAFLQGTRAVPNGLRIVLGGLEGDGEFEVVPPNEFLVPAPGQAMLVFAIDGEVRQGMFPNELQPTLVAVAGEVVVSDVQEAEFGPPLMTATIEATLKPWQDGAAVGEPLELETTLENMQ